VSPFQSAGERLSWAQKALNPSNPNKPNPAVLKQHAGAVEPAYQVPPIAERLECADGAGAGRPRERLRRLRGRPGRAARAHLKMPDPIGLNRIKEKQRQINQAAINVPSKTTSAS